MRRVQVFTVVVEMDDSQPEVTALEISDQLLNERWVGDVRTSVAEVFSARAVKP